MSLLDKKTQLILVKAALKNLEDAAECLELVDKNFLNKTKELHEEIKDNFLK